VRDLVDAIKVFVDRGLDQLVIYFAGHGFISSTSEFWLLSEGPDDGNEAISLKESKDLARRSGIPNVVFISDACRSRADSLSADGVHGSVLFPTRRLQGHVDVDLFLATRIGDSAWEVPVRDSVPRFEGIYTACFLDAFKRPYPKMVLTVKGKPVVPNRRLKDYLAREVPKKVQEAARRLKLPPQNQQPDAEVCSDEPTYIGHVLSSDRLVAPAATPTLSDVASTAIGTAIGGGTMRYRQETIKKVAASSGFDSAFEAIAQARNLPSLLSARTGFTVFGQRVESVTVRSGITTEITPSTAGKRPSALIAVDLRKRPAASVVLRFADGSGTVVAALDEYVGSVVVDEGRVMNVSYVPSQRSPKWLKYQDQAERLEQLRAAVAAAARLGVFRIEGPSETRKKTAAELTGRIRTLKGVDPTLGLYAAYAYDDSGLLDEVRSVREDMRRDLKTDLLDVAMLPGDLSGRTPGGGDGPYPFCPMLSQGWALLRVKDVRLHESVMATRDHLRPSLWTTLDPDGMQIVEKALREGRVT
jgi:hypothetical protein